MANADTGAVLPVLVTNTRLDKVTLLDTKLDNARLVVLTCDVVAVIADSRALPTVLAVVPAATADAMKVRIITFWRAMLAIGPVVLARDVAMLFTRRLEATPNAAIERDVDRVSDVTVTPIALDNLPSALVIDDTAADAAAKVRALTPWRVILAIGPVVLNRAVAMDRVTAAGDATTLRRALAVARSMVVTALPAADRGLPITLAIADRAVTDELNARTMTPWCA